MLSTAPRDAEWRLSELIEWFKGFSSVLVAFSGGVDSGVVAAAAKLALGEKAYAVTGVSPSLAEYELQDAVKTARVIGIRHLTIQTEEFKNEGYLRNLPDRCYFCKEELGSKLRGLAERLGVEVIVDGTNADDLAGHRPGYEAIRQAGIRSPLVELGIGKREVREIAAILELPVADKPSSACLSSRIAYGQRIEIEDLKRVARAERIVREITGARIVRVRLHGSVARIEVDKRERRLFFDEEILDRIDKELQALGFAYVTLDLGGYVSGSMLRAVNLQLSSKDEGLDAS